MAAGSHAELDNVSEPCQKVHISQNLIIATLVFLNTCHSVMHPGGTLRPGSVDLQESIHLCKFYDLDFPIRMFCTESFDYIAERSPKASWCLEIVKAY